MKKTRIKLRRCPVCNGEARIDIAWDEPRINGSYGYICKCQKCGSHTLTFATEDSSGRAWNQDPILEKNSHQISIYEILR